LISGDDIEAMKPDNLKIRKVSADVAQYYIRQAFNEGYNAANGRGQSQIDPKKGKWFDHWMTSRTRQTLIENGLITGLEGYK
jgi:hypothetical protein